VVFSWAAIELKLFPEDIAVADTTALEIANSTMEVATLPEITLRIVQVVQDPRSTANDLHKIVRNDPALSARVLRVVNSAFYGLPGQIGSIDRAIMLLGLNAVKNIAIAASLSKMFKANNNKSAGFSGKDLWTHSVAVGALNKLITGVIGLALPDEAFLAGLMHDIGLVAVLQCKSDDIDKLVDLIKDGVPFLEAERQTIGTDHQAIGMALAEKWKFPRSFQYVTGYHHNPEKLGESNRVLAVITHISDAVCNQSGLGLIKSDSVNGEVDEVEDQWLQEIGISQEQLHQAISNIDEELEVVRAMIE
jgi:HD-like signal output (HDOD) protein